MEHDAPYNIFLASQNVSEDRPKNMETAAGEPLMSERPFLHNARVWALVHVEDAKNNLVADALSASQKGVYNCLWRSWKI